MNQMNTPHHCIFTKRPYLEPVFGLYLAIVVITLWVMWRTSNGTTRRGYKKENGFFYESGKCPDEDT